VAGPYAVTEMTIAGLEAGGTYRFAVQALAGNGAKLAESEPAQVTLPEVPPNDLAATATGRRVALEWTAVPDANAYAVLVAAGPGPLVPDPARAAVRDTSVGIDSLPPGVYAFQIEARDAVGGILTHSNIVPVRVGPAAAGEPPAPWERPYASTARTAGGSFPVTARRVDPQTVELSWPALPGVGAYAVYQAQDKTPLAYAFTTGAQRTTITGLVAGRDYTFQVRARGPDDTESATSDTVSVRLDQEAARGR
jgi:hypothetical protein